VVVNVFLTSTTVILDQFAEVNQIHKHDFVREWHYLARFVLLH